MKIFMILALISTVYGEAPAPYPASGWKPQGQQFALPSRQPHQQYGAPQQNQQAYNTVQYSTSQQLNQQYAAPQIDSQYGSPISNQYGAPQNGGPEKQINKQHGGSVNNQYGAPQNGEPRRQINQGYESSVNQYAALQNGGIQNQYGGPQNAADANIDPLRTQYLPSENSGRNFAESNPSQATSNNQNVPSPGKTYLSQIPNNPNNEQPARNFAQNNDNFNQEINNQNNPESNLNRPNSNLRSQQQSGQLKQQNSLFPNPQNDFSSSNQDFQNVEFINPRQNSKNLRINGPNKQRANEKVELQQNGGQEENENFGDEFSRKFGSSNQPLKQLKKPERTTPRTSTEEQADTDANSDSNVAVSNAVAASMSGHYFILQQDGRLQRVVYMTSPDPNGDKNAAVIANLMYETVEPIKGPIFQYFGDQLVRIN